MEKNFGEYIKSARLNRGLGQRELSRMLGVSPSLINEIELGKRPSPSPNLLEKIKAILNIEDDFFYDLASFSRNDLPVDVVSYLRTNKPALGLVRTLQNLSLTDEKILDVKDLIASQNCKAIILAAGRGSKQDELAIKIPICLLEYEGKTILEHQLNSFKKNGITEVSIVTGFQKEKIKFENLKYYENTDYKNNNVLNSLFFAEKEIQGNIIISYSDIMFSSGVVERLLGSNADISLIVDVNLTDRYKNRDLNTIHEAENVIFDANLNVIDIGKIKPLPGDVFGEFIGMIKLSPRGSEVLKRNFNRAKLLFWDKPYQRSKTFQKAYITDILKDMIELGVSVQAVIIEKGWQEIVTREDFTTAIMRLEN